MLLFQMISCLLFVSVSQAQWSEGQQERDKVTSLSVCRKYQRDSCLYSTQCQDVESVSCVRCLDQCRVLLAGFGVYADEQVDEATLASPSYQCRVNNCFSTSMCQLGDEGLCARCLTICAEKDTLPPTTTLRPEIYYSSREDCEIKRCFQTNRCEDDDDDPRPCQLCLDECRELMGGDETTPDDVSTAPPNIPFIPLFEPEQESVEEEEDSTVDPHPATLGPEDLFMPIAQAEHLQDVLAEQRTVQPDAVTPSAAGSHGDDPLSDGDLEDKPVRTCLFWCRWRGCARKNTCESCFQQCDYPSPTNSPPEPQPVIQQDDEGSGSAGDIGELLPVWTPDPRLDNPEAELKIPDSDSQFKPPVLDVAEASSDVIVPDNVVFQSDSEHAAPCLRNILSCAVECLSVCMKGSTRECITCGTNCFIDASFYRAEDRSAIRPSTTSSSNCAVGCLKPCHRPTSDLCIICATNCIGLIAAANNAPDSPADVESVGAERGDVVESVQVQQSNNNFCGSYCEEFKQSETQFNKCTTDCCYWHPPCAS